MRRITQSVGAGATAALGVLGVAQPAFASTGPSAEASPSAIQPPSSGISGAAIKPDGSPSGCPGGDFCAYSSGNGGNLCEDFSTSSNLTTNCAENIQSSFNNSSTYSDDLWLKVNYTGAYYGLGKGDYLLYMAENYFDYCPGGGTGCFGYNTAMADSVYSVGIF
jgi:hypothetical protein